MTIQMGSQSRVIAPGTAVVDFTDFLETNPKIICWLGNNKPLTGPSTPLVTQHIYGHFLRISWEVAGLGIITMPVLPARIIYAPLVDSKKSNTASISNTTVRAYASSMTITSVNSKTVPVSTTLSTIDGFLQDVGDVGKALGAIPVAKDIGKYMTDASQLLSAALGSQTITQTVSNSLTNQAGSSFDDAELNQITAKTTVGGPGVGDIIAYYTDAKLVWLSHNGKMELTLLGYDQTLRTPNVYELHEALERLKGKPKGTRDAVWNVDAVGIESLLALDPFTGPRGPYTTLDPARFTIAQKADNTEAKFQNGGADIQVSVSHAVSSTDTRATTTTTSTLEVDKAGFLSFLGIGETENKTLQYSYSKSLSSAYTIGQTLTAQFTLHGDGEKDHYKCAVYFDNVFGTFAFRDFSRDPVSHVAGQ